MSGWTPPQAAAFLKKHGMALAEDVGEKELTERRIRPSAGRARRDR